MTAANDVRDLLKNSSDVTSCIPSANIKSYNLPKELVDKTDENVALITEVSNSFNQFASDHATGRHPIVEVQVWFNDSANIDEIQDAINITMENNYWYCYQDYGVVPDPDTQQLFWTIEYTKNVLRRK
jgi:hypothetical protein